MSQTGEHSSRRKKSVFAGKFEISPQKVMVIEKSVLIGHAISTDFSICILTH